jgi:lipoprotein-anchoring transpeptidase ErfK/SrfK
MTTTRSTITVQALVDYARSFANLSPIFAASGWEQEPGLSFANNVIGRFLAEGMNWKFNRNYIDSFYTVSLQQDYIGVTGLRGSTTLADYGWLESGTRTDYRSTADVKPVRKLEAVRDLPRTSVQWRPFKVAVIPVELATFGTWEASTLYPLSSKALSALNSPIQQFVDANGNFLYVADTTGDETSGTVEPSAPANSVAGTTVTDNNVTWKVADPTGYAVRFANLPPKNGQIWQIDLVYQKRPELLSSLQDTFYPIPDQYGYLLRQGFIAFCKDHSTPGSRASLTAMQTWEEALIVAVRSGDREQQASIMYPTEPISESGPATGLVIDPAYPFAPAS